MSRSRGSLEIWDVAPDSGAGVWKKCLPLRQQKLCFPWRQEKAEGMVIQPKSSPACLQMLACLHGLVGVELSNSFFFFQLHYAHCDNRRLNCEQHYETSEIDVSISWYSIPGMTCLLCPLTVLVEAYQNAGHMFSNSIAGIQLEKCVSLNYSHMLYIPLQHIISYHVPSAQNLTLHKTICFEFECIYFLTQNKTL